MLIAIYYSVNTDDTIASSTDIKTKNTKYFRMEEILSPKASDRGEKSSVATELSPIEWEQIKTQYIKIYETQNVNNKKNSRVRKRTVR